MLPNLSPMEMIVILSVAILLFGKRLPEVGRSLGRGIVEFKKGLRGVEEELRATSDAFHRPVQETLRSVEKVEPSVPKFESAAPASAPIMEYEPQARID